MRCQTTLVLALSLALLAGRGTLWAAPGDLDPTFGSGGFAHTSDGVANALVLQPDGRLIGAGSELSGCCPEFAALTRYNPDGTLDGTFGSGGTVRRNLGGGGVNDVVLQPDGKLVAGGARYISETGNDFVVLRYHPDGTLDSGFGNGGEVGTPIAGGTSSDEIFALLLQPDAKIVAGGKTLSVSPSTDFGLARYNPDGTLDSSFGNGGIVTTVVSVSQSGIRSLVLGDGGKIVAGGFAFGQGAALARYNSDGTLDSSFGNGGIVKTDFGGGAGSAVGLLRQPDGKLVAAGGGYSGCCSDFVLVRYNPDGTLDGSFGSGGIVKTDFGGGESASAVVLQPDGRLVAAGLSYDFDTQTYSLALARYNPNGTLDSNFGSGGRATTAAGGSFPDLRALVLQPDGKLVVGGREDGLFAVARYEGDGVDSDGDGLLDEWETNGVSIDPDDGGPLASEFVDLPAMGANPGKPDIFLHIDWMDCGQAGSDCDAGDTHSHKLDPAAIKKVVDAFAMASYTSPTGSKGINLHVDAGPASVFDFATNRTWGELGLSRAQALPHIQRLGANSGSQYCWADSPTCPAPATNNFQVLKDTFFTETGRAPIFHYVVTAHDAAYTAQGGVTSGISRSTPGSDLIVSLGSSTNPQDNERVTKEAGTLMHELGHNLGLHHGGDDTMPFKPNYLSVMNYAFQLTGLIMAGVPGKIDYSRFTLLNLEETLLSEPAGLGAGAAGYGTRYFCPGKSQALNSFPDALALQANKAINWNCNEQDGTEPQVCADLDGSGSPTPGDCTNPRLLRGHFNDWLQLQFRGGAIGSAGVSPPLPIVSDADEATAEMAQAIEACTDCQTQLIPGGGASKSDCMHEWQTAPPPQRYRSGANANRLECIDGDSNCDFGATAGECMFHVALCFNLTMPLSGLPSCSPTDLATLRLLRPKAATPKDAVDEANRDAIEAALGEVGGVVRGQCTKPRRRRGDLCVVSGDCDSGLGGGDGVCAGRLVAFVPPLNAADHCTAFAEIRVPLAPNGAKGTKRLRLKAAPSDDPLTGKRRRGDTDSLKLACTPP